MGWQRHVILIVVFYIHPVWLGVPIPVVIIHPEAILNSDWLRGNKYQLIFAETWYLLVIFAETWYLLVIFAETWYLLVIFAETWYLLLIFAVKEMVNDKNIISSFWANIRCYSSSDLYKSDICPGCLRHQGKYQICTGPWNRITWYLLKNC